MQDVDGPFQALQIATGCAMTSIEGEVCDLLNPLQAEGDGRGAVTLAGLFTLLFARAHASRNLVSYGMDWDAEIITRAFYETAAKILFLCVSPDNEKANLLGEYWAGAAETHNRRKRTRAALIEKQARPFEEVATAIFSLLQDDRVTPVSQESTHTERRALEQKWSFGGILEYLSEHADKRFDLGNAKLLLHVYGMASHFAHSDHNALDLMEDRRRRPPEERRLVEAAHASRILTDQASIAFLCAAALCLHLDAALKDKKSLLSEVEECLTVSKPIMKAFYDSQRSFYASYGYKFSEADESTF